MFLNILILMFSVTGTIMKAGDHLYTNRLEQVYRLRTGSCVLCKQANIFTKASLLFCRCSPRKTDFYGSRQASGYRIRHAAAKGLRVKRKRM
jgi:hypothetical protein